MKICAIVVTYNRVKFLERCLNALVKQTVPIDKILIVDNCSSDGTVARLNTAWLSKYPQIQLVQLQENMGGAGGFYAGMRKGVDSDFDYLWLMDDDGFPQVDCLEKLLRYAGSEKVIGPIVATDTFDGLLCFPVRLPGSMKVFSELKEFQHELPGQVKGLLLPFNGTLIPRSIPEKIGYPRKEYFIWGDEIEYSLRVKKYGYSIETISEAVFYHPRAKNAGTPMFFGKLRYNDPPQDLKLYCFVRNAFRTYLDYKGCVYAFLFLIKIFWFYLFTKPSYKKLKIALCALYDSINGNFDRHRYFIKK